MSAKGLGGKPRFPALFGGIARSILDRKDALSRGRVKSVGMPPETAGNQKRRGWVKIFAGVRVRAGCPAAPVKMPWGGGDNRLCPERWGATRQVHPCWRTRFMKTFSFQGFRCLLFPLLPFPIPDPASAKLSPSVQTGQNESGGGRPRLKNGEF